MPRISLSKSMKVLEQHGARTVLAVGLLLTLVGIAGIFFAATDELKRVFDNIHWTSAYLTAAVLSWFSYARATGEAKRQIKLFALGLSGYAIGQVLWVFQVFSGWNPFPGPSDAFFILLGPAMFLAFG